MRIVDYYKSRGRRLAGVFFVVCAAYFVAIAVTSVLVLSAGRGLVEIPVSVWRFVLSFINGWTMGVGVFAAVVLVHPLWCLVRGGRTLAALAAGASFNTVGIAAAVFCLGFGIILGTMMLLEETVKDAEPSSQRVRTFAAFVDFKDSSFASFMTPETSVDIRVFLDSGFGYRHCWISCRVRREDLDRFARHHGYRFEQRGWWPGFGENAVTEGLYPLDDDRSRYLYCSARENKKEIPGWGMEGHLEFVYDIKTERLYANYYD